MSGFFPPFDPFDDEERDAVSARRRLLLARRFRPLPFRVIAPNLVTILALCSGLTAVRMAIEGHYDIAILAILVAAVLDGLDGRLARLLKGTSRFGAELDSLTDFVNFGVAPAVVLYVWKLHEVGSVGWIVVLIFAIAAALRLARFNTMLLAEVKKPDWHGDFFTGVPAPAGALLALLPLYIESSGWVLPPAVLSVIVVYTVAVAVLMVSKLPTYSGKKLGARVRRDFVLPLFVAFVALVGLLVSYTYEMLTLLTVVYLLTLPFGWRYYRRLRRSSAADQPVTDDEVTGESS